MCQSDQLLEEATEGQGQTLRSSSREPCGHWEGTARYGGGPGSGSGLNLPSFDTSGGVRLMGLSPQLQSPGRRKGAGGKVGPADRTLPRFSQ